MKNTANGPAKRNARIVARLRRIQGQVAAIERSLGTDPDYNILQGVAAARGAMNSLMAYLMEERLRTLPIESEREGASETIEEMIDIVHGFSPSCLAERHPYVGIGELRAPSGCFGRIDLLGSRCQTLNVRFSTFGVGTP